jgi:hypothetical protein
LTGDFLERIRKVARRKIIYTEHALDEMNMEKEMISKEEVRQVILEGDIIEDYPEDVRGHSCLMHAFTDKGRPIHVVCAPKVEYLGIITAYVPSEGKWERNFKTRR